jgi:hypothetical protein
MALAVQVVLAASAVRLIRDTSRPASVQAGPAVLLIGRQSIPATRLLIRGRLTSMPHRPVRNRHSQRRRAGARSIPATRLLIRGHLMWTQALPDRNRHGRGHRQIGLPFIPVIRSPIHGRPMSISVDRDRNRHSRPNRRRVGCPVNCREAIPAAAAGSGLMFPVTVGCGVRYRRHRPRPHRRRQPASKTRLRHIRSSQLSPSPNKGFFEI